MSLSITGSERKMPPIVPGGPSTVPSSIAKYMTTLLDLTGIDLCLGMHEYQPCRVTSFSCQIQT